MFKEIVTLSSLILGSAAVAAAVTIQNDPLAIMRSTGDLQPTATPDSRPPRIDRAFGVRSTGEQIPENDSFVITARPPATP